MVEGESAYTLVTSGNAPFNAPDPIEALTAAYQRGESDEFVKATAIHLDGRPVAMDDGDAVIYMNFRADRARQLTRSFLANDFNQFERGSVPDLSNFITLTRYAADIDTPSAFKSENVENSLGEYIGSLGMKQLRLAETEKYAHVTFFFSGGREETFPGEDRILVPSPKVATYDLEPEMSAVEVTDELVKAITEKTYELVICNYANGDMVGHTGLLDASIKAVECIDRCLSRVIAALDQVGGQCLITADHGNVEQLSDPGTNQPHTAHTSELPKSRGLSIASRLLPKANPLTIADLTCRRSDQCYGSDHTWDDW